MNKVNLETLASLCKRRGFIYQGSEIYGGLAGTWDYGPLGVALKRNITQLWWQTFVETKESMYGLDSATLMPEKVWEASGHLAGFKDPMVVCSNCHSQYRADHLLKDVIKKNNGSIEELKGTVDGLNSNLETYRSKIACPHCGKLGTFGEVRQFNMMLMTQLGAVEGEGSKAFLRPETAQGIFVNFKNVVDSFQPDLPFGIAQIGKAYRNEISPRDFLFRAREFEQMEIEYFVEEKNWEKAFDQWETQISDFLEQLGLSKDQVHKHVVPKSDRAHYSNKTVDFEFDYPFGRDELLGLAYRGDYDLSNHEKVSKKNIKYIPKDGGEPFLPHVIEPSFGVDRLVLAVLASSYSEDELNGENRVVLKLPTSIAPAKVAISPLLKNKPELVAYAKKIYDELQKKIGQVIWDDNGNIGKRYRRQDEIGTPYCVTVDFQTLEDHTFTLRDRDTAEQHRLNLRNLITELEEKVKA